MAEFIVATTAAAALFAIAVVYLVAWVFLGMLSGAAPSTEVWPRKRDRVVANVLLYTPVVVIAGGVLLVVSAHVARLMLHG